MTWQSIRKVLVGAAIAALGAVLTYGTHYVTGTDFGSWTPVIMAVWSVAANLIRKVVTDNGGTVAAVTGFVVLMSLLAATARADDTPPPAVYVPPPLAETVQRHDAEIRSLRDTAASQVDVNAAVLAELKALRADVAALKEKPATLPPPTGTSTKPAPAVAWGPDCPECNTPGNGCGCPGKWGGCQCEAQAKARAAAKPAARATIGSDHICPVPGCGRFINEVYRQANGTHSHVCPVHGEFWHASPGYIAPNPPAVQQATAPPTPPLTLPAMGGCANGSCSSGRAVQTVQPARGGFFRR